MMKQAKAGKPIDIDAVPPPVTTGAAQPASSQPDPPAAAAPEGLGTSNKAEKHEQATQDGIAKSLQDSKLCMDKCFEVIQSYTHPC